DAYRRGLGRDDLLPVADVGYPRISWVAANGGDALPVAASARGRKDAAVEWTDGRLPVDGAPFPLAERLAATLADGGCAAVVCNTVGRAQRLYRALDRWMAKERPAGWTVLDLLHARFP